MILVGGASANMLAIWPLHGVDRALREAYASGTVLTGGCACWYEAGVTDALTRELGPRREGVGMGFPAGSCASIRSP